MRATKQVFDEFTHTKAGSAHFMLQTGQLLASTREALLLRFDVRVSPGAGSRATWDPGVSQDRTRTGWLS